MLTENKKVYGFIGGQMVENNQKEIMLMEKKKEAELTAKPDYGSEAYAEGGFIDIATVKNQQREIIEMENE